MMNIVNLTPHTINIQLDSDNVAIPPSGDIARVTTHTTDAGVVSGIPTVRQSFGDIQGLPDPKDGTVYLVSGLVLAAVKSDGGRADVFAPDTGPDSAVRDDDGRIIAVRRLVQGVS